MLGGAPGGGRCCRVGAGQISFGGDWYDYETKYRPGGMELRGARARISATRAPSACASWPTRCSRAPAGGPRARGLLRGRRAGACQRAEHDAWLHADERLRQAPRGSPASAMRSWWIGSAGSRSQRQRDVTRRPRAANLSSVSRSSAEQRQPGDRAVRARLKPGDPDQVVAVALPPVSERIVGLRAILIRSRAVRPSRGASGAWGLRRAVPGRAVRRVDLRGEAGRGRLDRDRVAATPGDGVHVDADPTPGLAEVAVEVMLGAPGRVRVAVDDDCDFVADARGPVPNGL